MKLEDLKKLANAATPGPWSRTLIWYALKYCRHNSQLDEDDLGGDAAKANWITEGDADFIVACRDIVPKLIAVAEAAKDAAIQMHCMCRPHKICEKCDLLKELEKLEGEG